MPRYTYNGKTYNVPDSDVAGFLSRKPSAKPLEANAPVMTSVGIGTRLTATAKKEGLTPRGSNIPAQSGPTDTGNQPQQANPAEIAPFQPMTLPQVGPMSTKLASPAEIFAPKSNEQVVGETLRGDVARYQARPDIQFDQAVQVYRDSGQYERDKMKGASTPEFVPQEARDWLDTNATKTRVPYSTRYKSENSSEQTDLINSFLANDPKGQAIAEEHAAQVKWVDDKITELEAKITDAEKNAPRVKRSVYSGTMSVTGAATMPTVIESPENYEDIGAARDQLRELNHLREAIKDGDRSKIGQGWQELKRRFPEGALNIATLGISDPLIKAGVNRALQNPDNVLTKEAADLTAQYQSLHAHERSIAQDIAQGTYGSLAFMAQFAATGGIAAGVTKGTATAIASKLGGSLAAKAVGKMGETVGKAFIQTALSPSTLAGAYELNMQNPGSFLDAYSQKFTQNLIEYASEGMGAAMPGAKIFGGAKTRFGQILGKVGQTTGVQDIGTEYLEEQFATFGHSLMGDGQASWSDFVDPRNQLVTLGSVALMQLPNVTISAAGYGAGKARNVAQTRSIRKGYDRTIEGMTLAFGRSASEYRALVDEKIGADPETAIPSLIEAASQDTELNDRQRDAIVKYGMARAAYQGLDQAKQEELEAAEQSVAPLVEQNVNPQTGTVRTIRISGVDTPVQSLGGNIVRREDGTIDRERSDKQQFYADPETGERKVIAIEFVEDIDEDIPAAEAAAQMTEMATAPIIARQENAEVRPYEIGEMARATVNGGTVVGQISGVDASGNYIIDVETPNGMTQVPVEPRQIVNEDNLQGVENGSEIIRKNENGEQVRGIVATNPDLYLQGMIGLEDGSVVPIDDIVGLASEWGEQATAETTEAVPQSVLDTDGAMQSEQGAAQGTEQTTAPAEPAQPFTPRTFEIDKNVTATSNPDGTYSLNTRYAKSELKKADTLVKRLNEDYSDNGMTFETVQLPRVDASNPFEKPMWGVIARTDPAPSVTTEGGTVVEAVDMPAGATVENPMEPQKPKKLTPRQKFASNTIPTNLREAALLYMMGGGKLNRREFMARTGYGQKDLGAAFRVLADNGMPFDTFESDFYATYHPAEYEAGFESDLDEITQAVNDYIEDRGATDALKQRFGRETEVYDPDGEARAEYQAEQVRRDQAFEDEIFSADGERDIAELITFAEALRVPTEDIEAATTDTDLLTLIKENENGTDTTDILAGSESPDSVSRGQGEVDTQVAGTAVERDGRDQEGGSGVLDSGSRRDNLRGVGEPSLSEAEQRIADEAGAAFDAELTEAETQLREKRAELATAKSRLGAAYIENNQTSLFGTTEPTAIPGNLFEVPKDSSQANADNILVPIQQEIDALAERYTALLNESRDARIQAALDNFRSQLTLEDAIARAEAETDTNPTEAQIEAGNYKKGHVTIQGFNISIENPKGSVRSGVDENGYEWSQEMRNTYGYIGKTQSRDGDHIDVFLGDNPESGTLFVVDQVNPATGQFDEHKVMLGFDTIDEARDAYMSNYEDGWQGLGGITAVDVETFRSWAQSDGRRVKPFAEYKVVRSTQLQSAANHFKPITARDFNDLIERLRQTGLARDVVTDPARMYEALASILGEQYAVRFLSLWHGSPATFKKFSAAFIGTGEGAQAFGYGLYFTNRKDIAEWYANKLKPSKYRENAIINDLARESLESHDGDAQAALAHEKWALEQSWSDKKRIRAVVKILETGKFLSEGKSTVYEVEIGNELNFMQWDEALPESQMAAIGRQAKKEGLVDKWGHKVTYVDPIPFSNDATGERVYNQLAKEYFNGSPADVSAFLERAGINGVRYPAASSSAVVSNKGGDNYVVFDDNAIRIIGKVRMMATPTGDVYGFVTPDGTVYLDSSRMNANTPIHEFGHLWNSFVKASSPELWARGSALIRQSEYWAKVNANPAYNTLSDDRKVDEALAMAIGDKGEAAFSQGDVVAYAGVKGWIYQAWEWIKSKLGIARGSNIEDMTLGDFTDLAVRQLLGGKNLRNSNVTSTFVNENDSDNGTGTKTRMDNRRTVGGSALEKALGGTEERRRVSRTVKAADIAGIDRTVREAEEFEELESRGINPYFSKPNFRKALIEAAKENGVWLESSYLDGRELMHDQRARGTSENDVYRNPEGGALTKLNNLSYVTGSEHTRNLAALIDRIVAHNEVFPNVAYVIKGFMTNKNGMPSLVMEQPEVDAERNATQEEIDEYLMSIGFELSGTRSWSNEHLVWSNGTYELFDARPANVLMGRDGNLYFIDTIPHSVEYMDSSVQLSETISRQEVSEMEQIKARTVVDGSFMKAPNGKRTNLTERQWLQVRTANFKKWFGDWENDPENASKVIDANGEPLVVYHGGGKNISEFHARGMTSGGMNFFTSDKGLARKYGRNGQLYEVFLDMKNPDIQDAQDKTYTQWFDETGGWQRYVHSWYTEAIVENLKDSPSGSDRRIKSSTVYAIGNGLNSQIKSATGNTGAFDPENSDIRYQANEAPMFNRWQDEERYNMHKWIVDRVRRKYKTSITNGEFELSSEQTNELLKDFTKKFELAGIYEAERMIKGLGYDGRGALFYNNNMGLNSIGGSTVVRIPENQLAKPSGYDIRFQSVGDVANAVGSTMTEEMRQELDVKLKNTAFRFREAWEDKHLAVKKFFDTLRKNGVKIPEYNDYYQQVTALNGKIDARLAMYGKRYQIPLNDAIRDLQNKDFLLRDIENYAILKHGLERNDWMRRYAVAKYMAKNPNATEEQISAFEASLPKDFSGITAVEKEVQTTAGIFVTEFEQRAGQELIDNLWARVKDATTFSLKKQLDGGLIDKKTYDDLVARYQYYIPLRGHDAETAEDRWDYSPNMGTYFVAPLMKARGRTSRSESPFAYIFSMAQSAINSANRNILNQSILRIAQKDTTGLMSVSKTWYMNVGYNEHGKPTFEAQSPAYSEDAEQYRKNIEEFEARMEALAEQGMAFKGRKKLNIGGIFIKPSQASQHEVHVYQNGEEYTVYINANPAVARAINGSNVVNVNKDLAFFSNVTRQMASNFTTRNPIFVLSNFSRDYIFSSSILAVKEDARYALQFQKNILSSGDALQRYVRGKGNLSKKQDRYLSEYILNGGKTGFSHILELQRVQSQIERDIKRGGKKNALDYSVHPLLNGLEAMNEIAENMSRLSVYITSREMGRSVSRSISDAKEVTVNFNRSGAGGMGSQWVRPLYLFVNAGIQALANFSKVAAKNPGKAAALIGGYAASGFLIPFMAGLLGGDDGRDEYMKLPDWDRQNNLCIYTGRGFIKIPLPHELRVFHKMGDNIFQAVFGYKDVLQASLDTTIGFADLLPANPTGAVDGSWADMMPDAVRPLFQWAANRNYTGARITNEWADSNKPGYLKVRTNKKGEPYAPSFLVKLAEGLDDLTGGDGVEKGIVSLNPDIINHLMRGYFGGLYTMTSQGLDVASKTIDLTKTGEFKLKVRETPLRTFYASSDDLQVASSGLDSRYYKASDDIKETLRLVKGYQRQVAEGELGLEGFFAKINELPVARANEANSIIKQIGKFQRALKELHGEDQREAERIIADLKQQAIDIYRDK